MSFETPPNNPKDINKNKPTPMGDDEFEKELAKSQLEADGELERIVREKKDEEENNVFLARIKKEEEEMVALDAQIDKEAKEFQEDFKRYQKEMEEMEQQMKTEEAEIDELTKQVDAGNEMIEGWFKELEQIENEFAQKRSTNYAGMTPDERSEFDMKFIRAREILGDIKIKMAEHDSAMKEISAKIAYKEDWGDELKMPDSIELDDIVKKDVHQRIAAVQNQINNGEIDDPDALRKEIESIESLLADLKKHFRDATGSKLR